MAAGRAVVGLTILSLAGLLASTKAESFEFYMLTSFWPPEVCQQKSK
jgi:hypothetical protein